MDLFHGKSEDIDCSPRASRKMLVSVCLPARALQSNPSTPLRAAGFAKKLGELSWWSLGDPGIVETPVGIISAQKAPCCRESPG